MLIIARLVKLVISLSHLIRVSQISAVRKVILKVFVGRKVRVTRSLNSEHGRVTLTSLQTNTLATSLPLKPNQISYYIRIAKHPS